MGKRAESVLVRNCEMSLVVDSRAGAFGNEVVEGHGSQVGFCAVFLHPRHMDWSVGGKDNGRIDLACVRHLAA